MALSYYSNWETFQYLNCPDTTSFPQAEQAVIDMELQGSLLLDHNMNRIDPILTSENYNHLLSFSNASELLEFESYLYLSPYRYPNYSHSKPRLPEGLVLNPTSVTHFSTVQNLPDYQRQCGGLSVTAGQNYSDSNLCLSDGFVMNPTLATDFSSIQNLPDFQSESSVGSRRSNGGELPAAQSVLSRQNYSYSTHGFVLNPSLVADFSSVQNLSDFQSQPPVFSVGSDGGGERTNGLSVQSVAARQRRRKITEKTQELGKLVPGGHKMNTAEMFQAAYKYIKYLQAQVGVLQLMGSIQENEELLLHGKELQELATSSVIQEKLYAYDKCLATKQFVENIANDSELRQPNSVLLREIHQLIPPRG